MINDLSTLYATLLHQYEKDFKCEAVAPFQSIEIHNNPDNFEGERLGIIDNDNNYHLHRQVEEIFPDLIDFAALLSFIPREKRDNWNLISLLFVIKFSKSNHSQLREMVQNFTTKFIQEGSFNPDVDEKFLKAICFSIPIDIIMSDYLSVLMALQSISAQFDIIIPIYYNLMSKQVKAGIILQFLNKPLDLFHLFQRTMREKRDLLEIYQKYHFGSYFFTNFGKLGLTTFLGEIYFHPSIASQNDLVVEIFGDIPFITQCYFQNGKIMLYFALPLDAISMFKVYLERLQHVHLITHFYILSVKSYESSIYLTRTQNKESYINSFLPFSGRHWFLFSRPLHKMHDLINKHYHQQIDYTPSQVEFIITPLHLLILLSKSQIFDNLFHFSNMRDFLSNTKKIISSNAQLREIPPKIWYSKNFSETYDYFIESGFFNQFADFSSAKKTLEVCQASPQGSVRGSLPSKFLKPGQKILVYADLCKYPSLASLKNYSSDEFFSEITQIASELKNKQKYSQPILEMKINQLFSSQILQENRGNQTIQFFDWDIRFFMIQIRTERLDWLESILFSIFQSNFGCVKKNVNNYQILLSVDYWRVFARFLINTPMEWIEYLPVSAISTPTHDLLFFYNFTEQKWDIQKFSLLNKSNQIASLVKKYLPLHVPSIPFNPVHDEKNVALFPSFSLPKFMQGVFILRKDNEIAQKLMKSPPNYFEFLRNTFLRPSFNIERGKSFLRENYTFEFAQIKRILTLIPNQRSEPHSDLEMGRYILIIRNYLFPCHPRVLLQDGLLKGLFCSGLHHVFFFGGIKEGLLVLEYLFPKSLVSSPEFKLQELLNRIEQKYLLYLKLQSVTEEFRFVSPEYTSSASLEIKQYQHIALKKADQHISHPSFLHIPKNSPDLCEAREIPDAFWQVVGHPVTLFVHISCSESMKFPLVNMLMQLPIGKILVSGGDSKPFDVELIVWIHLAGAIDEALDQLIQLLEIEEVRYFLSPIIDYSIINDPNLNLPL